MAAGGGGGGTTGRGGASRSRCAARAGRSGTSALSSIRMASSSAETVAAGTVSGSAHAEHYVRFPANESATRNAFPQTQAKLRGMGFVGVKGMRTTAG